VCPFRCRLWRLPMLVGVLALAVACSTSAPVVRAAVRATTAPAAAPESPAPTAAAAPDAGSRSAGSSLVLRHGRRDRPLVALTFDSNMTTYMERELDLHRVTSFDDRAAIDELIRLRVPATFFLSGLWMERYPAETRRLGVVPFFELGSHGYTHRAFTRRCFGLGALRRDQMAQDIARSEQLLHSLDQHATRLFRFPGGCFNGDGLAAASAENVRVVQYDVASGDAFGRSVQAIIQNTLGSVRNGSIVVLHITGGNTAPLTPYALPAIVEGLRSRGFTLVTVSRLLAESGTRG
jgi:peptidoglycan/xylan/chitin deacetylase (PgdA/CDA1 family)